jgi:squamous cell carcinoma antigen recognized by T-cells 3
VNRLEVFTDKHEAVVEFQLAADAARLLLLPDPLEFNGVRLRFSEGEETPAKARNASTAASGMFIPRTAASRPRAGLGRQRNLPPASAVVGTSSAQEAKSQTSSGDKATTQGKAQDDFRKMLGGK